jgi:hypothetical protein
MEDRNIHETEQEYDARMLEEGWYARMGAVDRAKNELLQSVWNLYPGDDQKTARSVCYLEHMKILIQKIETEYGESLPEDMVGLMIEELFKLSQRKGWGK